MFRRLRHLWQRHVALPSPQDLGRLWTGGLPSRQDVDDPDVYTWEDWEKEVEKDFPLRWKIDQVLTEIGILGKQIGRAGYWLRCHTYDRRHLLDLSQAEAGIPDGYRWGYLDPCRIMLLASFLALRIYVEKDRPHDPATVWTPDELAEDHLKERKAAYDEAMFLCRWWTVDRLNDEAEATRLSNYAHSLPPKSPEREQAMTAWLTYYRAVEQRPHEMLMRLAKIQETLWT